MLAASQGIIRADGPKDFIRAWKRLTRIIKEARTAPVILAESFVPGSEVALEGLLEEGRLRVLAIFDKPEPLDGPFFEETIYVRPSRLSPNIQSEIISCVAQATGALGLERGPVHAEVRVNKQGPWIIEVAARPIGGRCSKALRFGLGVSLEEVILRQALGQPLDSDWIKPDPSPSGVMMIPIPRAGTLIKVFGLERAREVEGIEEILVTAYSGQTLVPLPEGSRYLGFIFARATTRRKVENALRRAHRLLRFEIQPAARKSGILVAGSCEQGGG
jgi:biotin carboxylase